MRAFVAAHVTGRDVPTVFANPADIPSEERGVAITRSAKSPPAWSVEWDELRHYDP